MATIFLPFPSFNLPFSGPASPSIIGGIAVAAAIGAGLAIWFAIRFIRKRAVNQRREERQSAFLNVRGIVKVDEEKRSGGTLPVKGTFNRNQLAPHVIMPEKAVIRPGASRNEIIDHYAAEGKLPRPFAPFSLAMSGGNLSVPAGDTSPVRPLSTASFLSIANSNRLSIASTVSSLGASGQRKSFDDGWCIVGRDSMMNPGDAELGAAPAWCFLKPVKGLRAERPMRISSLGVTVNLDVGPGFEGRDNVMSWSNF
ncbi:hypothetical protein A0H81_07741 [Grifola frondosa]|uniref:Uncharacterized protein n=1 Tax=Grifola frondosa TaxID=5627 RepID=A0A1C7M5A5_GRIFR|nr:hypothetical protein A0H81_07741 [Grifola frondosa]